ncbi:cyanate transporter [Lentzea pudingi]|uniref:Cyanate transporter n=1 Tax=Lentzea pudingi TaxID=1789439 RepID=A0ABQ2HPQ0_9PSEU|nr:MFS transporter [Lentzea pudingi]GGM86532.1 cyanate transporter [Lentzea pudingi]
MKVRTWAPVLVASVFLVALNLRPALTSVGPLLPRIGAEAGLTEGMQGLLGALPLLAFAAISPLIQHPARRFGAERSLMAALVLLALGTALRSGTGDAGLWIGTAVAGCAIAIGNVLVPTIVKRDYRDHVSPATGVYSACITVGASIASAVAVPLSHAWGWRGALAFWAVPALVVAVLWLPRAWNGGPVAEPVTANSRPAVSVWRQPTAWLVTAFMGLQSTTFYIMVTWFPTVEISAGVPAERAGVHLFVYQLVGVASGLAIPHLLKHDDQVVAAVTASVPMVVGVIGLVLLPAWSVVWAVIAGLGTGASLVVALTLISLRGHGQHGTTQLSGMAQSLGYLLAAVGPVLAGHLAERTGSWTASLVLVGALGVAQVAVAFAVGRVPSSPPGADQAEFRGNPDGSAPGHGQAGVRKGNSAVRGET